MDAMKTAEWDLAGVRRPEPQADGSARTWPQLLADLARIRGYENDWDGEGTEAISPALMDAAVALAHALEAAGWPAADIVAGTFDATICFDWRTPTGSLALEVESSTRAEAMWLPKGADRAVAVKLACI